MQDDGIKRYISRQVRRDKMRKMSEHRIWTRSNDTVMEWLNKNIISDLSRAINEDINSSNSLQKHHILMSTDILDTLIEDMKQCDPVSDAIVLGRERFALLGDQLNAFSHDINENIPLNNEEIRLTMLTIDRIRQVTTRVYKTLTLIAVDLRKSIN